MTKLHKKKANIFGKKIPVLLLVGVLAFGLATAALLPYFGQITGSVTAEQGLYVDDGNTWEDTVTDSVGPVYSNVGGPVFAAHSLTNDAGEDSEVKLTRTGCTFDGTVADEHSGEEGSCDETNTGYLKLETLEDSNSQELIWGDGLNELEGELEVSVSYDEDKAVFKAVGPSDYDYS